MNRSSPELRRSIADLKRRASPIPSGRMRRDRGNPCSRPSPRPRHLAKPAFPAMINAMPRYDFRTPRLYLTAPLQDGEDVVLDRAQVNYLRNVLRLKQGDEVVLFNGRDGEWRARLAASGKRELSAAVGERLREQPGAPDLHFLFAPLKHARLD